MDFSDLMVPTPRSSVGMIKTLPDEINKLVDFPGYLYLEILVFYCLTGCCTRDRAIASVGI